MMALTIKMLQDSAGLLAIKGTRVHSGFTQDKKTQQPELTYNGSFLRAQDLLPAIGYNDDLQLIENRYRRDRGLEKLGSRMSPISDSVALHEDVYSPDATWLRGTIELSTTAGQVALGPGVLIEYWQTDERNYYKYSLEHAAPFEWYFGSANYNKFSFDYERIQCHIYYKPTHFYNIPFFEKSFLRALNFIESQLGEYPFSELKLMEIPFYQKPHYTFPNTIAISEKEGWFADSTTFDNRVYLEFTIASNLIAHWVLQNVPVANVQGADMLRYALPECLAMQMIREHYGQDGIHWLLTKKQGLYARERGNEPNIEPPLIAADGTEYLERNKGAIELYQLSQAMGVDQFNDHIKKWADGLDEMGTFYNLYLTLLESKHLTKRAAQDIQEIKTAFEQVVF